MMSKYDDNAIREDISEGKRHYQKQKKTSLFGSETPRTPINKISGSCHTKNDSLEDSILSQNEILRKDRLFDDSKHKSAADKRATLEELESYNPWGRPGAGAANINYTQDHNSNRSKWEYEQELKKMNEYKRGGDNSYPGFAPGFGSGNIKTDGRRRSETSSIQNDVTANMYYPFGTPGGGAPISDSYKKSQEATVTVHRRDMDQNEPSQKLEEAKAYGDHLEQEIQRMKLKQMEDRYSSMKNSVSGSNYDRLDNNPKSEYDDDALYREAENRARVRELERLKESYQQQNSKYESDFIDNDVGDEENDEAYHSQSNGVHKVPLPLGGPKRATSSSTHNDYRPYSVEEYTNSRQQLVNPVHVKRTTLSGSEEVGRSGKYRNGDGNQHYKMIEEENVTKQPSNTNTYNNIFPSDRTYSASKAGPYSMKTPYATD